MALSLNRVEVCGNLAADPEVRFLPNGDAVANLRIAVSESYRDKDGNKVETTEWIPLVLYRKTAELAQKYLRKGDNAYFEGKWRTRSWTDKENVKHYKTEVEVTEMKFNTKKSSGGGTAPSQNERSAPGGGAGNNSSAPSRDRGESGEDDIPFASACIGDDPMMRKMGRRFRGV